MPAFFEQILNERAFAGKLNFGFSTEDKALRFLGTKVTARVYFKMADGSVVYAANASDDKYINNGVAKKAALNVILDNGNKVTDPVNKDLDAYNTAKAALNTNVEGWDANRAFVLKYAVENAVAAAAK